MRQLHWPSNRACWLGAWITAIAVVWLGLLPLISEHPDIDAHIRRNERLGIDPSAKFYTEIPDMPALYEHVQQRRITIRVSD